MDPSMAAVLLVLCILTPTALGNCNNPMFSAPGDVPAFLTGNKSFVPLGAPAPTSGLKVCTMWNGKQSCCGSNIFNDIIKTVHTYDEGIVQAQTILSQVSPAQIIQLVEAQAPNLTPAERSTLSTVITQMLSLIGSAINCYGGMMTYFQGMLCTACDPEPSKYYASMNPANLVLNLAEGTCNGLWGACGGLIQGVEDFVSQMLQLVLDLNGAKMSPEEKAEIQKFIAEFQQGKFCEVLAEAEGHPGQSCQKTFCDQMIGGLNINLGNSSFSGNLMQRTVSLATAAHTTLTRLSQPMSGHDNVVESLVGLASHASVFARSVSAAPRFSEQSAPVSVTNQYSNSASAYNAYTAGCSSGSLSTHNCPSSKSDKLPGWAIALAVIGTLLGVALIAFGVWYYFRRYKPSQEETATSYTSLQA